jgi:hypothetical protein
MDPDCEGIVRTTCCTEVILGQHGARPRGLPTRGDDALRARYHRISNRQGSTRVVMGTAVRRAQRMLAEMRKLPGGSGVNMAMSATVSPDSSRCSATISLASPVVDGICCGRKG